ncbi:hypothetical protein [Flavobacterium sp.]|uniref:hypothetical protein n=1 Tax=Flavobacterium sp. TaxID=239 RepID=UPI003529677C
MKKSLKVGIAYVVDKVQFYNMNQMLHIMFSRIIKAEIKWMLLALIITFFLVIGIDSFALIGNTAVGVPQTFLGLNLFLEILVFFAFSTFVVFGIKGFFEMYSQRFANVVIFISGVFLAVVIFILSYQILMLE